MMDRLGPLAEMRGERREMGLVEFLQARNTGDAFGELAYEALRLRLQPGDGAA